MDDGRVEQPESEIDASCATSYQHEMASQLGSQGTLRSDRLILIGLTFAWWNALYESTLIISHAFAHSRLHRTATWMLCLRAIAVACQLSQAYAPDVAV